MAETGTVVETTTSLGRIKRIILSWTSHTDGTVSKAVTAYVNGIIRRVVFNPGATAPTDNYDVTITDADGLDVLSGLGANRHTTTTQQVIPLVAATDGVTTTAMPVAIDGLLRLEIAAAGSGKVGVITLYIEV